MNKDEMNALFAPATQAKKLKGSYIVWMKQERTYFANSTGGEQEGKYRIGLVGRKQKDLLITAKFDRIPLYQAYIVSTEMFAKWPRWDNTDDCKPINKDELIEMLNA